MEVERENGRTITVSNEFIRHSAMKFATPIVALVKEMVSNAISHTPGGKSYQRFKLVCRDESIKSNHALIQYSNSDASKFLNMDNPYDGKHFETIMDLGRNRNHSVVGDSQFNSGNKNCDFRHSKTPHAERIFYDARLQQGVAIVNTLPISDSMGTRSSYDSDCNKVFSIGFKVDFGPSTYPSSARPILVYFQPGPLTPVAVQTFFMHSRLAGGISSEGFDVNKAKRAYTSFLVKHVINVAGSPDVPRSTCFLYFLDLDDVTYTDPATQQQVQCYKECTDDIRFSHMTAGSLKSMTLRNLINRFYKMPPCHLIKSWKSLNDHKLSDITDHDIAVEVAGRVIPVTDPIVNMTALWQVAAVANMTDTNLQHSAEFNVPSMKQEDAASLGLPSVGESLPVTVYFFKVDQSIQSGFFTMWRDRVHDNGKERSKSLMTLQQTPLTEKTLYGLNNAGSKRDTFMSFCTALPYDIKEDYAQGGKTRLWFDKLSAAAFKAEFGIHPSVFLHRLESWATAPGGSPNEKRAHFYMLNVLTCVQCGNLQPNYDKDGCSDGQERWKLIRQQAIVCWMKEMLRQFPVTSLGGRDGVAFVDVELPSHLPPLALKATSRISAAATPAAATPAAATRAAAPPAARGKRPASATDSFTVPSSKKISNGADANMNTNLCCADIIKLCDACLGITKKHAQGLQRDEPASPCLAACNQRVLRLLALKREATFGNCAVLINATNTFMRVVANIKRNAHVHVFLVVVNGKKKRDLMMLNREMLELLFNLISGNDITVLRKESFSPLDTAGYLQDMLNQDNEI